jgi:hypothetical protein
MLDIRDLSKDVYYNLIYTFNLYEKALLINWNNQRHAKM